MSTSDPTPGQHPDGPLPDAPVQTGAPLPLLVACALVGLEAVLLVGYGAVQMGSLSSGRVMMGLTDTLFFLVYGGGLGACAWLLSRLRTWTRAPVVLAQLIQVLVAWSFRDGDTTLLAVLLAAVGVAVLAGVFHPASTAALAAADREDEPS